MYRKKYMIRGGIYVIIGELIIGGTLGFLLYNNYSNITKSESIKENYHETFTLKSAHNSAPNTISVQSTPQNTNVSYSGFLGEVTFVKQTVGTEYNKKNIDIQNIQIHPGVYTVVSTLLQQPHGWIIDTNTVGYLINEAKNNNHIQIINDLNFLTKYTQQPIISSPGQNPQYSLDTLLSSQDPTSIINSFQTLDNQFTLYFINKNTTSKRSNPLLVSEKFAYVYNNLHVDQGQKYREHINLAANLFGLNPNIIKSTIFVEQLRAFYTFKGLFKTVAKTNTYLTIMSKQSFGIGGMKLATAEKLEQRLQNNKPEIYNQYFAYTNSNNINNQRLQRLTDTKNYYYQILYSAGVLYRYNTERKKSGYDLSHQPGLLATLYNIGFSKPHANADIGGSFMNIEGSQYSFGGLAMFIYYFLEIYG